MARIPLALLVSAAALAACTPPPPGGRGGYGYGYGAPAAPGVVVEAAVGYAAMDEVPVGGGELRLVEPIKTVDASGANVRAIAFPLRHTDVRARVAGMSAMYTLTQTFENPYDTAIDAVYVFPLGAAGAVTSYAIVIGDRTIAGEIKKQDEARAIYAEAKAAGHTAALLEQKKRNVFEQRIANLAPRETIQVRMEYVELLGYADGQYELAVPLVVGPRYLPAEDVGASPVGAHHAGRAGRAGATSIPYASETIAGSTVSFTADVDAGVPVLGVASPSHQLRVEEPAPTRRRIALANAGELPNRDLVVRFRTAAERTMLGVLAHRAGPRGYFTLAVQPKAAYKTGDVTPREVMIVVDTSGSMSGEPIELAKQLAIALVDTLRPHDTFNVMAFSGGTQALAPAAIPGDAAGKAQGQQFIASLGAGGGTEMGPAIVRALATSPGNDRIRLVYFMTDGFVGNDDVIVSAARKNLGANRIFSIGIGSAPNRALLDQLAAVGRGFASYLHLDESAAELGEELVRRTAYPYLTDVEIEWNGLAVGAVTPAAIPDVYAGMPLVVSGVYTHPGRATVTVTATAAGQRVRIPIEVTLPERADAEPVAALWARRRIDELYALAGDRVTAETAAQITEIGLGFHMVTEYTSFVAVDRTRVVDASGNAKVIEQPALAPAGVELGAAIGEDSRTGYASYSPSAPAGGYARPSRSRGWGGGGGGGGGDVDLVTLLLALGLVPLAWTLRRIR